MAAMTSPGGTALRDLDAVIFDMDGVVTQTAVVHASSWKKLFDARVDGVVSAERGLPGKPDPATFLEAARELKVEPARAAVVEDALSGVAAGRAGDFGLVVGVARAGQTDALRDAGADVVVADLAELEDDLR